MPQLHAGDAPTGIIDKLLYLPCFSKMSKTLKPKMAWVNHWFYKFFRKNGKTSLVQKCTKPTNKALSQKSEKPKRLLGQIWQALKRLLIFFE